MPNDNPTDEWARDLLNRAADTIDVDPAGPVEPLGTNRIWPMLAAVAAVIAVLAGTAFVALGGDPAPSPTVVTRTDDGTFRLGPDQIPSVFAFDEASAIDLLTKAGLDVQVRHLMTCREPEGRALRTHPATGWIFSPGSPVTVVVSRAPEARCARTRNPGEREKAWRFLDFANGRGEPPAFAETVTLYAGGNRRILTQSQANDPDGWSVCDDAGRDCLSAITTANAATRQVERRTSTRLFFQSPSLGVNEATALPCADDQPAELKGRKGTSLYIGIPSDGLDFGCHGIVVFRNDADEIDSTAVADTRRDYGTPAGPADVVGTSAIQARQRLEAEGFTVREVPRADCAQPGMVTIQAPNAYAEGDPGTQVTLGVVDHRSRCNHRQLITSPAEISGEALVAFSRARGEAPSFADHVGIYVGNVLQLTLTAQEAADPSAWDTCPHYAHRSCPLSPLRQLGVPGPVVFSGPPPESVCLARLGDLPDVLEQTLDDSTRIDQPEPYNCRDTWAVQVWIDDTGAISAANLLLGDP